MEISKLLSGNPEFYNLPRKFKISVTGCPSWCSHPEINDIALTAIEHNGQIGYSLRVGGGLCKEPHLALRLNAFVLPEQAVRVARTVAEIFREQQGLRENRDQARLKYLFLKEGWTAESFLAELQSRLDFTLLPGVPEQVPDDIYRDHAGIHPQHQPGLELRRSDGAARPADRRPTACRRRTGRAFRLRRTAHHSLAEPDLHRHPQPENRRNC